MRVARPPATTTSHRTRSRSGGFTLLEVLVAIVVLSFGVLGMVGMQAMALQANKEARSQSAAVQLANELADMMRGNRIISVGTTAATNPYLIENFTGPLPANAPDCFDAGAPSAACTVPNDTPAKQIAANTDVAEWEVHEWLTRVVDQLPGARVVVCLDSAPYDASGMPQWACTAAANAPVVIKIGWTRMGTDRGTGATASTAGLDQATRPSVMVPLTPGSTT